MIKIKNILKRLKSPIVAVGILAQIVLIVGLYSSNIADYVKIIGTSVIEILTLIGFINNPTDKTGL